MTSKVLSWSPNRIVLEQRLVKAPCFQSDQGHLGPTTESFAVKWLRGGVWFSPQFLEKDIDPAVMKCRRPQTVEGRLIFLEGFHRGFDPLDRGCQTLLWGGGCQPGGMLVFVSGEPSPCVCGPHCSVSPGRFSQRAVGQRKKHFSFS